MAVKSVSIRIEEEMLEKHGPIAGDIRPDINVKPSRK